MRPRRSLLFMPGDDLRKIGKGAASGADGVVMDLEDGVALNRKADARATVVEALTTLDFGRTERLVRLNPAASGLQADDLAATVGARPDGYVLPKVERPEELLAVSAALTDAEQAHGWPIGSIGLLAIIETALGVMNLREIGPADGRLQALIFGAEDLAGDIGATRTAASWEVFYARSAVLTAAAAYGVQAIDTVFIDLSDTEGLGREAAMVAGMGYSGKLAIHPRQVAPINAAFTPTTAQVEAAERLIAAHEAHQASGAGVFAFEGKMVDMPMVRAAERLLAKARAATGEE